MRLIDEAEKNGLILRLLGGIGIRHVSPSSVKGPWKRSYHDIDFVAPKKGREKLEPFFEEQGYTPHKQRNLFSGDKRLLFYDLNNNREIDVFISAFDMCHYLDLEEKLCIADKTLTPENLFLTKIQIIELNKKDILDLGVLLNDITLSNDTTLNREQQSSCFDIQHVARLCAKDWGWYRTVTKNIQTIKNHIFSIDGITEAEKTHISGNLNSIEKEIEAYPKTLAWKTRNIVGDKVQWYNLPEDLG